MANFENEITKLLRQLNHNAVKLEGYTIRNDRNLNLTLNEIHLIECIKLSTKAGEGPTISAIAAQLDITRPSTTVAVNKLVAKKYVEKSPCASDGRSVRVKLTQKGDKAYSALKKHNSGLGEMLKSRFTEEECAQIADAMEKLNGFFESLIDEKENDEN
ncbi:MAG: MarR family transcriptional regulator [Bacteroides sp.]|nr:MarR family transcriptional regulator [Roseburia sp.]MCM1462075.1 MarR family transcriptional regulator [Bacteroides sp.]